MPVFLPKSLYLFNKEYYIIYQEMEGEIKLNGSVVADGSFVWGGALTLAWKKLISDIVKQPIKVNSNKQQCLQTVSNFNRSPLTFQMLNPQCYYVACGFGNETVQKINKQVSQKFPQKSTAKLVQNLQPEQLISYAYLYKNLKFEHPFSKKQVDFKNRKIPGFEAKPRNKKQVLVYDYDDENNFIIQLKTLVQDDHIFILKSKKLLTPEQVVQRIGELEDSDGGLKSQDVFEMPVLQMKQKRQVSQLKGVYLKNKNFEMYRFEQVYEIINFELDETGAKVENQGVIRFMKCKKVKTEVRKFILNKPFWIVMRQKQHHPYFVAYFDPSDGHKKQK